MYASVKSVDLFCINVLTQWELCAEKKIDSHTFYTFHQYYILLLSVKDMN